MLLEVLIVDGLRITGERICDGVRGELKDGRVAERGTGGVDLLGWREKVERTVGRTTRFFGVVSSSDTVDMLLSDPMGYRARGLSVSGLGSRSRGGAVWRRSSREDAEERCKEFIEVLDPAF